MGPNRLKQIVDSLPEAPGVYLYKDAGGNVIYIGKAKSLKKRVQSYFSRFLSSKTQNLVSRIADIEYILAPSEFQAQLLEASLIKERQPYYNISLKDDKSFPLIKITSEKFPLVSICRLKDQAPGKKDTNIYYGPYANAKILRQALKVMRRIFGFRSCETMPKSPCLYYRLKLCPGPCAGRISAAGYKDIIKNIRLFLDSKYTELIDKLSFEMRQASQAHCFEEAARIRDTINALSAIGRTEPYFSSADQTQALKTLLGLKKMPLRIEGFDISNISGKEATGSMVSFYKGAPDKGNYRRFRIKTVNAIDDYAMLREVVKRRYSRLVREGLSMPDLILIDGGRQHLLACEDELSKLGLDVPVMSIEKQDEKLYIKGRAAPIKTSHDTAGLNLIRRVRDEAHRFARKYHHYLHKKKIIEDK
jgi:excinuclease ABC subunit C